jgi:hypothetical protein
MGLALSHWANHIDTNENTKSAMEITVSVPTIVKKKITMVGLTKIIQHLKID